MGNINVGVNASKLLADEPSTRQQKNKVSKRDEPKVDVPNKYLEGEKYANIK